MSGNEKPQLIQGSAVFGRRDLREDTEYQVKPYDFKKPDRITADQFRTIQMLHEIFARVTSVSLSAQLRSAVEIRLASVDQMTYQEFSDSIPNPTFLAVIQMNPLRGNMVMQLDPVVTFAVLDRLFGGQGRATQENRELTDIELSVMEGLIIRLFGALGEAWSGVVKLDPKLGNLETDVRYAQIVPPSDMVILATLKFKIGSAEGFFNFCYPYITLEPVQKKLFAFRYYDRFYKQREVKTGSLHLEKLQYAPLPSEIAMHTEPIPLKVLAALKPGAVIPLREQDATFLEVAGSPVFAIQPLEENSGVWRIDSEKTSEGFDELFGKHANETRSGAETEGGEILVDLKHQMAEMAKSLKAGMENLQKAQLDAKEQLHFLLMQKEEGLSSESPERKHLFHFLENPSPDNARAIGGFLASEHPQLTALVLSQLEATLAAELLRYLPSEIQVDVCERLAKIERVVPEVLGEVARVLERNVAWLVKEGPPSGGIRELVNLLGQSPRELERRVIEGLEKTSPETALAVKQRLFVFEDIEKLDDRSLTRIVQTVSREDLLLSLKTAAASLRQAIVRNLPKEERPAFEASLAKEEPLRLSEIEAAQLRVVSVVRVLEGDMEKR